MQDPVMDPWQCPPCERSPPRLPVTKPVQLQPRYTPQAPMPTGPLRTIALSSCVPEPPEEEVLDWTLPESPWSSSTIISIIGISAPAGPRRCCCFHCLQKQCQADHRKPPVQTEHEDIVLEFNDVELTSGEEQKYDRAEVTMDAGAGAPVANPADFPGCVVTDSPCSLAGQINVGPGKERIPNEGQFVAPMRLENGRE